MERLVAVDPTDFAAIDRLAELATRDGQPACADQLRREKAEVVPLIARYRERHQRNQPIRDAAEIGRLARQLGHEFEARAFLTLATAVDPQNVELRRDLDSLSPRPQPTDATGRTLADVLAAELDPAITSAPSPATATATPDAKAP